MLITLFLHWYKWKKLIVTWLVTAVAVSTGECKSKQTGYGAHNANQAAWRKVATVRVNFSALLLPNFSIQLTCSKTPKMTNSRNSSPVYHSKYCMATLPHTLLYHLQASPLCLPGPSNARELQHLKDKNRNKNADRSTNNWAQSFETSQKQRGIYSAIVWGKCWWARRGSTKFLCWIEEEGWDRLRTRVPSNHAGCTGQILLEQWLLIQHSKGWGV